MNRENVHLIGLYSKALVKWMDIKIDSTHLFPPSEVRRRYGELCAFCNEQCKTLSHAYVSSEGCPLPCLIKRYICGKKNSLVSQLDYCGLLSDFDIKILKKEKEIINQIINALKEERSKLK